MSNKIVTIAMTIFLLLMCLVALATMGKIREKQGRNQIEDRTVTSVLDTNGVINKSGTVVMRGSSLISAIKGLSIIDNRISAVHDKVYSYQGDDGVIYSKYSLNYLGKTNANDIITRIQNDIRAAGRDIDYSLTYTFNEETNVTDVKITKNMG